MSHETVIVKPFSTNEQEQYDNGFSQESERAPSEMARFGKNGHCLPAWGYKEVADFVRNDMVVYPDDLWIVTPPKCGTTWIQEIVWLIHTDVDLAKAQCNQFYR